MIGRFFVEVDCLRRVLLHLPYHESCGTGSMIVAFSGNDILSLLPLMLLDVQLSSFKFMDALEEANTGSRASVYLRRFPAEPPSFGRNTGRNHSSE